MQSQDSLEAEVGQSLRTRLTQFVTLASMLLGLPLLGVALAGNSIGRYLEFPPRTLHVEHAPFSWIAFILIAAFVLVCVLPFVLRAIRVARLDHPSPPPPDPRASSSPHPFPAWGWLSLIWIAVWWILAWNRFPWFARLQPHTFTPLWLGYIVAINALGFRKTGHSMLTDRPLFLLFLFPLSTAFWWFFEYLNRFTQNWCYEGAGHCGPLGYFFRATLPFSTVLPAVISTREWLTGFPVFEKSFRSFAPMSARRPRIIGGVVLALSAFGLAGIGVWPDYLYPFLWVSPLLIIVSLQTVTGERHIFSSIVKGDWRMIASAAVAALICGFFWELWNFYSEAKWIYLVPFVNRFHIFEMPLLGYAGYLPFGLECVVIAEMSKAIR